MQNLIFLKAKTYMYQLTVITNNIYLRNNNN